MPIELRNLTSGDVIEVPNEGHTIGREGGAADLQLQDKGLSSRHARIFADGTDWLIQDLGSTNGTKIADVVVGKEATNIRVGDIITMSDTQLEVMRIWDPKLQHTVVMMAAPIFDTKPSVQAVRRSAPKVEEEAPEPESANPTMIGYSSERASAEASNKTMVGYGAPAAVTVEQPAAASEEPDMTAKTLIGYSADRVAAAMAQAPRSPAPASRPEEQSTTATLVGFSADRVATAMAQAPVTQESSSKTLIGYGAPQFAPVPAKGKPGPPTVEVAADEQQPEAEEEEAERPVMHTVRAQAVPRAKAKPAAEPEEETPQEEEAPADDVIAGGDKGLKYFLVAVPKAIAFYLAAVPLMIVNPMGTIRKGVEEQKHEAKGRMELIAYALPVNLFSAAVGFISTLIVQLVSGTLSIGGLIVGTLLVPAIIAVIASVVTGFIWHPVVSWVVMKLKGESDERSRTNYFLMFMTATALVVLPTGIGTLLGLVPFRLVAMVQPILSALGTVVVLFVTYSWMVKFEVVKWFRTVLLVLGGIVLVGGVFGAIGRLSTPAGVGGGTMAGVTGGDVEAQIAAAQKQADDAMKAAAAAGEDAQEQVKAAQEDVKVAVKTKGEKQVPAPTPAPTPAAPEASVTFPVYVQMREAVEKKIADDPAVLSKSPELQALYREYTNTAFEIDARFKALNEKAPADAKLNGRLRDAEVFAKTEKAVVALHAKLKPAPAPAAPAAKEETAAPAAKEEKPKAEAKPAPAAKEEKPKAEAKPAPAAKEEKPKAEAKPAPAAKEEKPKAEAKPAPAAKEEKPKAEAKPAPAAKEEKPKAEAKPAPAGKGRLAASSKPPGAEIWIDGKNTGKKTPLAVSSSLEVPAGKHTVLFKMNGKSSAPVEVVIEADKQAVLKGVEIP